MSGHTPDPEFPAWRALLRVHRGGVARVGRDYVDNGRRIPAYIVDALDELTKTGQVSFGEPDPIGFEKISLTPAGQGRLTALDERLAGDSTARTGPAHRWAVSPTDHRSHVIDDGLGFTRCGQYLPSTIPTSPSLVRWPVRGAPRSW